MLADVLEKPATVENPLLEVSKIRFKVTRWCPVGKPSDQAWSLCCRRRNRGSETHRQAEAITGNGHSFCGRRLGRDLFNLGRIPSSLSAGQQNAFHAVSGSRRDLEDCVRVVPPVPCKKLVAKSLAAVL